MINLRLGKEKHEKILNQTLEQLEHEGYKTLNLDGKSPTLIAVKDNITVAITVMHGKNQTITELEDRYKMFDRIDRVYHNKYDKQKVIDGILQKYKDDHYNILYLENKSPDAIAIKDNLIYAVEVLGIQKGCSSKFRVEQKESVYDMFDGRKMVIFYYDDVEGGSNLGSQRMYLTQ